MTGLEPAHHVIVEIASIITDDDLRVIAEGPDLVVHATAHQLAQMPPIVQEMHTRSGLLSAIEASQVELADAERQTLDFLRAHIDQPGAVPLCGNSIGTDRHFLHHHMPELEGFFHYRNVDVSTIKELVRRWRPELLEEVPDKASNHRALDDIRESIAELQFYRERLFGAPALQ